MIMKYWKEFSVNTVYYELDDFKKLLSDFKNGNKSNRYSFKIN